MKRGLIQIFKEGSNEVDKRGLGEVGKATDEDEDRRGDEHEKPIMGDLNTIVGECFGGGVSSAIRKRYARSVMQLATKVASTSTLC